MATQMDIYECIEVATTGSDGKPPVQLEREPVRINESHANSAADVVVDEVVDYVEHALGLELTDEQWELITLALKADFAESIVEAFSDL